MTSRGLTNRLRRIVYGEPDPHEIAAQLSLMSEVDLAHVVMLAHSDLLPAGHASALAAEICALRQSDFEPLHQAAMPRGLYLAYEQHLIAELGPDVGGRLHTARSRNDMKATVTVLRLRSVLLDLLSELTRLQAVLLARARSYQDTVMPLYTHYQPAMPATYGYYLLGVASALSRDVTALIDAAQGLRRCPMGAVAVAGTDLPVNPAATAALLGFECGPVHALDAVAAHDAPVRVLAAAAGAGVTMSRLGTDLQLWSTAEFCLLTFPDRLVGGSSAMPQKRNAFLLEHVKAKPAAAIGAWTAAMSAMKSVPFTNSIETGTEAVAAVWPGIEAVRDTVLLLQSLVSGARPNVARMTERTENSFVSATVLANRLVREGTPFRTAHETVGAAVRTAIESGTNRLPMRQSVADLVRSCEFGGGPGAFKEAFTAVHQHLHASRTWLAEARWPISAAQQRLATAVARIREA